MNQVPKPTYIFQLHVVAVSVAVTVAAASADGVRRRQRLHAPQTTV